jgi:hypothetical protein
MFGKYENNKLTVVDTLEGVKTMTLKGFFEVPSNAIAGQPKEYYNEDFSIKELQVLIDENIITLEETQKVFENRIIDKSEKELYLEGLKELPETLKIENGEVLPKTTKELFTDDIITREEYQKSVRPIRNSLLNEVDLIFCNALNLSKMTESRKTEWETYKQQLRDYPQSLTKLTDYPIKPV